MTYQIEWKEKALDDLNKLEVSIIRRIIKKVDGLCEDPFSKDITTFDLECSNWNLF